jgi:large subunit ribosomal protein L3
MQRSQREERKVTLGLYGEKLGMTQIYNEDGIVIPVTVIKIENLTVTQIKTKKTDGYDAIQVGFCECKKKKVTKAQVSHLEKNKLPVFKYLKEFKVKNPADYELGQEIDLSIIENVEKVDVTGKSIGKGFQGTVKRHNFSRGPMSHGSKNHRLPGSIGAGTTPGRVYKGLKMAGKMGNKQVTVVKLKVARIDKERNLLLIKGSVPGPEGKIVKIQPSRTKWN